MKTLRGETDANAGLRAAETTGSPRQTGEGTGTRRHLFAAATALAFVVLTSWVQPGRCRTSTPSEWSLDILALYKSSEGQTEEDNPVYEFLEFPLSFLGYRVHYYDLSQGIKNLGSTDRYAAIVTWFWDDDLAGASSYRRWLLQQLEAGKKLLIFGTFGAVSEPRASPSAEDLREVDAVFAALGVRYRHDDWAFGRAARLLRLAPGYFGFERDPAVDPPKGFYPLVQESPNVYPLVELEAPPGSRRRYLSGFISPRGAFLAQGFAYYVAPGRPSEFKPQFYVDPIRFLRAALGCQEAPHPDLAVLFGRRVFFARIDGDGFTSVSELRPNYLCGAAMRDEILVPTPLPFTASCIQGEVDPTYKGSELFVELAREVLTLPNVEPASHGLGHPLDWETGKLALADLPGYTQLDPEREIFGSLSFLNQTVLRGKRHTGLFLWTGLCNPPQSVLREVRERDLLAINGGNCLVLKDAPSLANFSPPYRHVGGEIQVLRRAANDYEFTNSWQGPLDGYRDVLTTFEYGWRHYPMVPIDLYVHWYSAEKQISLQALKDVIQWVRTQLICPVPTSDYVRAALDFLTVRVKQEDERTWSVTTGGNLRTVRFDRDDRIVDLRKSRGVVGYCRRRGYLYVHLDEGTEHRIRLAPADTQMVFPPFVVESANPIRRWESDPERRSVSFTAWGFGQTEIWLAGLNPGQPHRIDSPNQRKIYFAESDSLGRLCVRVPIQGDLALRIQPSHRALWAMSYGRYGVLIAVLLLLSLYSMALAKKRAKQLQQEEEATWSRLRTSGDPRLRRHTGRGSR
ncbi:MAG: hypothetical protein ONB23_11725 [candidate division KSB1 bacterium]|nr:hypothetical protein [candidate division KSB1 bacterium]